MCLFRAKRLGVTFGGDTVYLVILRTERSSAVADKPRDACASVLRFLYDNAASDCFNVWFVGLHLCIPS